jgi:hypothetical protein
MLPRPFRPPFIPFFRALCFVNAGHSFAKGLVLEYTVCRHGPLLLLYTLIASAIVVMNVLIRTRSVNGSVYESQII